MKPWLELGGGEWRENSPDGASPWFLSCCAAVWQSNIRRVFRCRGITLINRDDVPVPENKPLRFQVVQTQNGPVTVIMMTEKNRGEITWRR